MSNNAVLVSSVQSNVTGYKGKGDPMECGSYRGIKLLEHAMKVMERIFKDRIRQQTDIDDMQFGFMKGKGTTDAIFMRDSIIYAIARICHGNSVCPSVCPSHGWISQKRLKLGSRNFHHTVAPSL